MDRQKRNLSSSKPEDLLPESPEIKRNLQHQSVRYQLEHSILHVTLVMVGLKCHRLGYGNIQMVDVQLKNQKKQGWKCKK
ncbi:hypothetical protein O3M35_009120 [Rhynocoris fuscipes]|uniref:Uncharacterized protein n=1 Tax=Rhynocoris fuscipes TaxID=488301 RepID=A0AAW1D8Q2_9HEMI